MRVLCVSVLVFFLQIQHEVSAFGVVYTAVAVSHSGHMVFVGTSLGTIRAMKYPLPLTKDFNEYQAHAGAVTKVTYSTFFSL